MQSKNLNHNPSKVDDSPLVSIGLTVFNAEKFLRKTLESLLAQSYRNIEIIISDNASEDSSKDICLEYASKDSRIKYHRNIKNLGPVLNFNQAFTLSSGEFFMWAADHDLWDPCYIEKCLSVLLGDPSVVLCYPQTILIDGNDKHIEITPDRLDTRGLRIVERFKRVIWGLEWCNMIYGLFRSSVLQRTQLARKVLGTDHVLLAEISLYGAIGQIKEPLFYRRENRPDEKGQQATNRRTNMLLIRTEQDLQSKLPWTFMAYEHLEVVKASDLTPGEKELLAEEIIKCFRTRFGGLMTNESLNFVNKGLEIIAANKHNKAASKTYSLELLRLANIVKVILPNIKHVDLLIRSCMENLGLPDKDKGNLPPGSKHERFPASENSSPALNAVDPLLEPSGQPDQSPTTDIPDLLGQGFDLLRADKPAEALSLFDKIISRDQNVPDIHCARAIALLQIGRLDEALEAARKELSIHPNHEIAGNLVSNIVNQLQVSPSVRQEPSNVCVQPQKDTSATQDKQLRFLQILQFYPNYIDNFYARYPGVSTAKYDDQMSAFVRDGFGAIHTFAPYMKELGYESNLVIANSNYSQIQWLRENKIPFNAGQNWIADIARKQIERLKPDILYMTDPITFDSRFIRSLSWKPKLVIGWRAANIPPTIDWSEFDIMLSSLKSLRQVALTFGAKSAEHFFPGFPSWIYDEVKDLKPQFDVVFSGQWTLNQHPRRNRYLQEVARAAASHDHGFSCAFYLSGQVGTITPDVKRYDLGGRFGIEMCRALRTGRIALDARGILEIRKSAAEAIDLAGKETANMRIFEATGCGVFLLTEHFENIKQYFNTGEEIETFRDEKELIDKIDYYIAHQSEREEIAYRGHERCLQDYSMAKRVKILDQIIKKHLEPKLNKIETNFSFKTVSATREHKEADFSGKVGEKRQGIKFTLGRNVQIIGLRNIQIDDGTCIGDNAWLNVCVRDDKIRMKIGKCVLVGRQSMISTGGYLEIGDYCVLAPRVYISDADHVFDNIYQPILQQGATLGRSVIVEENCWLGINVVVAGNLTVGRCSVIAANAVVTKDVPPFSIMAGVPAKIIKMYNPLSKEWESIQDESHLEKILKVRETIGIPNRDEYRNILEKNARVKQVDPIVAGRGICI